MNWVQKPFSVSSIPDASTTVKGVTRYAVYSEIVTGIESEKAVTPFSLFSSQAVDWLSGKRVLLPDNIGYFHLNDSTGTGIRLDASSSMTGFDSYVEISRTGLVFGVPIDGFTLRINEDGIACSRLKLGTIGGQLSLFGGFPASQPSAISDPTGGSVIDIQCRAQLSALLAALRSLNVIAL